MYNRVYNPIGTVAAASPLAAIVSTSDVNPVEDVLYFESNQPALLPGRNRCSAQVLGNWIVRANPQLQKTIRGATQNAALILTFPPHLVLMSASEPRSRGFEYALDEISRPIFDANVIRRIRNTGEEQDQTINVEEVQPDDFPEWDPLKYEIRMAVRDYFEAENANPDRVQ